MAYISASVLCAGTGARCFSSFEFDGGPRPLVLMVASVSEDVHFVCVVFSS